MLQRFSLPATPHEVAQRQEFGFVQITLKIEIQLEPLSPKDMREQMLGVQPGILDASLAKITGARSQDLEEGHNGRMHVPVIVGRPFWPPFLLTAAKIAALQHGPEFTRKAKIPSIARPYPPLARP